MLSAYVLLTMSVPLVGAVVIVPVVSAIDVMSVFAPDAAAPRLVRAFGAVVAFVPPFAIGNTPVTPVVKGRPVALVSVAADGVPRSGVVNAGDVASATTVPVPVVE
jgi:hypothetical protein